MECEDWEIYSEKTNDSEVESGFDDDEVYCYTSNSLSKLQFRKDVSKARWNEESGMAEIVEMKGRMWTTTGIARNGKIYCSIEETLFLAEVGALILLDDDDAPLSLSNLYEKVANGKYGCYWESFEAYRHLKSLGYIVGRHGIPWSVKSVKSNGDSLSPQSILESNTVLDRESEANSVIEQFKRVQINEAMPFFDVYLPNSKFRKSNPGNPSFILCLSRDNPPSRLDIKAIERKTNDIPLKFCHVEHGRLSYFCFNTVDLLLLP